MCARCSARHEPATAQAEETRLLAQYRDLVEALEHLNREHAALLEEQHELLDEQRTLLRRLLAGE